MATMIATMTRVPIGREHWYIAKMVSRKAKAPAAGRVVRIAGLCFRAKILTDKPESLGKFQ